MDPARLDLQMKVLNEQMVPGAHQAPGFIGGYWTRDPATNEGFTMLLFHSREAAEAMAAIIHGAAPAQAEIGVVTDRINVTDVMAQTAAAR